MQENRDRHRALEGNASAAKGLVHAASPSGPICVPEFRTVVSLKTPQVGSASNPDIAPGDIPVPPSRVIVTTWTVRPPSTQNEFSSFTKEDSKQDEEEPSFAGASIGTPDASRMSHYSGLHTTQDQGVSYAPHGNEVGSMMESDAQNVGTQWYQRPVYRWMLVGCILFVCGLVGAVVALVIILSRPGQATTQEETIACQFLSIPDLTVCQSTASFDSFNTDDRTTGSTIPSEIGLLTQLTYLDFSGNQLTSTIPSEIGLLTKLKWLNFYNNSLTSEIPSEMGVLTRLTALYFTNNSLAFTIPSAIGRLTQLTGLSFRNNELTSSIPSEIGRLTQLTGLSFRNNELTSSIPSEIGLLTKLTLLDFEDNQLTSTIPSEIGRLTLLTWLNFQVNALISTIPSEIGLLTQLTNLDFYSNSLTSAIPSEIGLLTQLSSLSFYSNSLTSTIPSEIGLLTRLTNLYFSNNQLTGTIPYSLCSLPSPPYIAIDCGEITCASGCCSNWDDVTVSSSSCG